MYKIRLPNFEGPFDLLLYFIKRDELNIYNIPIARITEEFLNYIRLIQQFDIELASDFIFMASELMYIKTQMLLPKPKNEDGEEIEDPRTELVQRLLEYKQMKEASFSLSERSEETKYYHYREYYEADIDLAKENSPYKNANLFDLMKAYKKAIDRANQKDINHVVELAKFTVEERKEEIIKRLNLTKRLKFFELVKDEIPSGIVITFLAILDLIRSGSIQITQESNFGDIFIGLQPNLN